MDVTLLEKLGRMILSPGARIRMLRIILGISREEFCGAHGINFNTLTSIELGRLKISAKQLGKIIEAFVEEGLHVSRSWIVEAKGAAPTRLLSHAPPTEMGFLENWARFFTDNRNAVMAQIQGDLMEPFYASGDLVGGTWHTAPQLLLGKRCIARIANTLLVGTLFHCDSKFALVPANPKMHHECAFFQEESAPIAEVLWHISRYSHPIPEIASLSIGR